MEKSGWGCSLTSCPEFDDMCCSKLKVCTLKGAGDLMTFAAGCRTFNVVLQLWSWGSNHSNLAPYYPEFLSPVCDIVVTVAAWPAWPLSVIRGSFGSTAGHPNFHAESTLSGCPSIYSVCLVSAWTSTSKRSHG